MMSGTLDKAIMDRERKEIEMKSRLQIAVIVVAVIWAAVIMATSMMLASAPEFSRVLTILGGGAAASIILLGGMIAQERKTP
jgi:hypothetical protein